MLMTLTLHHGPGSVCSQKVRLCLAEKGLAWVDQRPGRNGMRTPEYLSLNRDGVVPTLIDGDLVLVESRLINEYLEDAYPASPLTPADAPARWRMRWWTRQADDELHRAIFTLMFVISRRGAFIKQPRETWLANLPGLNDPLKQTQTMELAEQGFDSPLVPQAIERFKRLLADMESSLTATAWLAGEPYSLADVDLTPYLQRLDDLGLSALWRELPAVTAWFDRVRARPSFKEAIIRFQSAEDAALMARGVENAKDALEALLS